MSDVYGSAHARKKQIGEQLWLHYYNRVLFERGIITEDERNRMANRIDARSAAQDGRRDAGASACRSSIKS